MTTGESNLTIINNMWFDKNYGFKTALGFQNWVKVAYFRKTISKGIGKYLIGYFGIAESTMWNLVMNTSSWLVTRSNQNMGIVTSPQLYFKRSSATTRPAPTGTFAHCSGAQKRSPA